MSMSEFFGTMRFVANMVNPPADDLHRQQTEDLWLTPATVADFSEPNFISRSPEERARLRTAVEKFREVAELRESGSTVTPDQRSEAREAFETIWKLLAPYRSDESEKVHLAIWQAWQQESDRGWMPTFDYEVGVDSTGDPAVWIWFIVNDDVEVSDERTRDQLSRLRTLIRIKFHEAGIERWPYISLRSRSEAKELMAGAST